MAQKCKNIDAINLKSYNLSESDKIVLMYSKENGLIKCVAKGCKKPNSKLGARMDSMVANNLLISTGRNLYTICEAKSINTFKKSREDIDKLMYSSYICEVAALYGIENDSCSEDIYKTLYNALDTVANCQNKAEIIVAVMKFQLKFMKIVGFGIEFENCLSCQKILKNENIYFSALKGGIFCEKCWSENNIFDAVKLHYKIRDFLISLFNAEFNEKTSYEKKVTEKVCLVCFNLLKNYVQMHCPRQIKSVSFLEAVSN